MITITVGGTEGQTTVAFNGKEEEIVRKVILEPGLCVMVEGFEIFPDEAQVEVGVDLKMSKDEAAAIAAKFGALGMTPDAFGAAEAAVEDMEPVGSMEG